MNDATQKGVVVVNFDNKEDEVEVNFENAKNGKARSLYSISKRQYSSVPCKDKSACEDLCGISLRQ